MVGKLYRVVDIELELLGFLLVKRMLLRCFKGLLLCSKFFLSFRGNADVAVLF